MAGQRRRDRPSKRRRREVWGPRELWPPDDVVATANELAGRSAAHVMVTDDVATLG